MNKLFKPQLAILLSIFFIVLAPSSYAQETPKFSSQQETTLYTNKGRAITAYAKPDKFLNSHGLTFADGKYYLPNSEVIKLVTDEYEQIEKSRIQEQDTVLFLLSNPGDVIAFSALLYAKDDERLARIKNTTLIGGAQMIDINDSLVSLAPLDYPGKYRVAYFRKK